MLMYACYYNKIDTVSLLVSHGADRAIQCKKGRNAMMIATINGNVDILKIVYKVNGMSRFHGLFEMST